jgi:hypothetical protein
MLRRRPGSNPLQPNGIRVYPASTDERPYIEGKIACLTWRTAITDDPKDDEERPCLHCLLVDTIDNFFADYPVSEDEPHAIDSDEIVTALAKVVAEMTCSMEGTERQQLLERLMQDVMEYDAEFRQQDQLGTAVSGSRH